MSHWSLIVDCYTVEPAGLGFPPYISTYARYAYSCFQKLGYETFYATIDDFRACAGAAQKTLEGYTNPYVYSVTRNQANLERLIADAEWVIVIAGGTVPSRHLQSVSASLEELQALIDLCGNRAILYGPLGFAAANPTHPLFGRFKAVHTHTITPSNYDRGSGAAVGYTELTCMMGDFTGLFEQIPWDVIAEIELYRGCTRKDFCSFCFEPSKNHEVVFRESSDVVAEIAALSAAGLTRFRLGQQACFFSYKNRDVDSIQRLLVGIRESCPDIRVLHIDNVDPLAAASPAGKRIAQLVCEYCTPGNTAPMGIESFDEVVIKKNLLTCSPEILVRAMDNIEEYGAERTKSGVCRFLPGLNLIYGLPGETAATHERNLLWLRKIYEAGHFAGRTNIRQVSIYPNTPLVALISAKRVDSKDQLEDRKVDIGNIYDIPMKRRVFPIGLTLSNQHSFFFDQSGTWFRAYGSYPIMTVVRNEHYDMFEEHDLTIVDHEARYIFGQLRAAG